MLRQIVSGGQAGVDRGALDAAIAGGVAHGGWCPRGRRAEDGPIPDRYELRETRSGAYAARTEQNVVDSDATLILAHEELSGGTALTLRLAKRHARSVLVVDLSGSPKSRPVVDWLIDQGVGVLNVAGPRESSRPGIAKQAERFLRRVLRATIKRQAVMPTQE